MTGPAGGSIWRCIRSRPARATMRASPRGWSRAIPSTASIRRSTRSAIPATNWPSTPPIHFTPLGHGVSMGVHESQSRIYENQLGRSRAFTGWLFGQMQASSAILGLADADAFYATVNRVHPGYHPHRGGRGALQPARHAALRSGARADRRHAGGGRSRSGVERPFPGRFRLCGRQARQWRVAGCALVGRRDRLFRDLQPWQCLCRLPASRRCAPTCPISMPALPRATRARHRLAA